MTAGVCDPTSETVQQLLREASTALRSTSFDASPREAALLLGHVLGWNEAKVLAYPEVVVAPDYALRFRRLLERRLEATPVAYLLGQREFWGRSFVVDSRVLIPRPETEHLVEVVLELDRSHYLGSAPKILEVGTGSGCLAVTIALELPSSEIVATDLSPGALALARRNAKAHGVSGRVRPIAADMLSGLHTETFDLVISNPPYVAPEDAPSLSPEVLDHEPGMALFGEGDGMGSIGRLLRESQGLPFLAIEIGAGQEDQVVELAEKSGWHSRKTVPDLAGIPRILLFSSRRG